MNGSQMVLSALATAALLLSATGASGQATFEEALSKECPGMSAYQKAHPHPDPYAEIENDASVRLPELRIKLLNLWAKDEKAGADFEAEYGKATPDKVVVEKLRKVRSDNLTQIEALIGEHGFPTTKDVGSDGVWAAYVLALHADGDSEFQRRLLPQLKEKFERGEIPGTVYAYLSDRTLVAKGEPQVYGTQFQSDQSGLTLRPLLDLNAVGDLRQKADMPSLEDYLCFVGLRSGTAVKLPQ